MSKANKRFREGKRTHAVEGEYKIPLELRKYKKDKWTTREKVQELKRNSKKR